MKLSAKMCVPDAECIHQPPLVCFRGGCRSSLRSEPSAYPRSGQTVPLNQEVGPDRFSRQTGLIHLPSPPTLHRRIDAPVCPSNDQHRPPRCRPQPIAAADPSNPAARPYSLPAGPPSAATLLRPVPAPPHTAASGSQLPGHSLP